MRPRAENQQCLMKITGQHQANILEGNDNKKAHISWPAEHFDFVCVCVSISMVSKQSLHVVSEHHIHAIIPIDPNHLLWWSIRSIVIFAHFHSTPLSGRGSQHKIWFEAQHCMWVQIQQDVKYPCSKQRVPFHLPWKQNIKNMLLSLPLQRERYGAGW